MTHLDRRVAAGSLRGCTHANQSVRLERPRSTQLQRRAALGTVFFLSGRISKRAFRYRNSPTRAPVELFLRRVVARGNHVTLLLHGLTETHLPKKIDFFQLAREP